MEEDIEDVDQPASKKPRVLSPAEDDIVINVYKYVKDNWTDDDCTDKTAEMTGIVRPAVHRRVRERKSRHRSITDAVDEHTLQEIRKKIYNFFHEAGYGVPTPENILRKVNEDERLPNFAMPTFRRVLRHLKYRHFVTHNRFDLTACCETFSIPVV